MNETGNHARVAWYQPGQLLTDDSYVADVLLGGNPVSAWTGAFAELYDSGANSTFHIHYTPPVDAIANIYMRVLWKHSVANAGVAFGVFSGLTQLANWQNADSIADTWYSAYLFHANMQLTRGTAYTFYGEYSNNTVGNLTWAEAIINTYLMLQAWAHP